MRRPRRPRARLRPPADADILDGSLRELSTGRNRPVWPSREPPAPPGIFPVDSCNENLPEKIIRQKYASWPVRRAHSPASLVVPAKVGTHEQPPVFPALRYALDRNDGVRGIKGTHNRKVQKTSARSVRLFPACSLQGTVQPSLAELGLSAGSFGVAMARKTRISLRSIRATLPARFGMLTQSPGSFA